MSEANLDTDKPGGGRTVPGEARWLGHPRGLSTLFFTEMWERFSYYGMRGILVLFMTNAVATGGLGMSVPRATAIYGLYTFGVYVLALPGGWMADRLLGQRRAVFIGGCIIASGHFSMAIPSVATFYLGLILILLGTGLLKPNVSAQVGELYHDDGARRDAGFSIFYMGINIGALGGPLVCGYLGENINWHLGFSAAGIGMIFGLIQYVVGGKYLGDAGALKPDAIARKAEGWRHFLFGIGSVVALAVVITIVHSTGLYRLSVHGFAQATGIVTSVLAVLYFTYLIVFGGLDGNEKKRIGVIFIFFVAAALFWSGFEQAGSSMNLFGEGLTDRTISFGGFLAVPAFDWEYPASWFQSVNPLFIIILAPVFGWMWVALGARNPSIPVKFSYGLVLLGVSFAVMAWGSSFTAGGNLVSPMWLVVTYFLQTTGELCLSPVGLSSITKLSPRRLVGQMMGIWFMGAALGNLIGGLVAGLIEDIPLPWIFGTVAMVAAGFGLIMLALSRPIQKLIGDVR